MRPFCFLNRHVELLASLAGQPMVNERAAETDRSERFPDFLALLLVAKRPRVMRVVDSR